MPPVVTFLSDFGLDDQFVGICHGVIVRTCPDAQVIHLGHGVAPQAVAHGARVLAGAVPYLPVGVHMAVVDPGVGSERRAVVIRSADGRLFVGPDNGLLVPAAEACGGIDLAVQIANREYMLDQVSRTFHGRDVFSPVAGHLAAGLDPRELGPEIPAANLIRCALPGFELNGSRLRSSVQHVDRFGNIQLSAGLEDVIAHFHAGREVEIQVDGADDRYLAACADTFADVGRGELVVFEDSDRRLSIAINQGSASELLDTVVGAGVLVEFSPDLP
jgi:S-adenosyl-L-methionine hydrolase (adenosine-forming)